MDYSLKRVVDLLWDDIRSPADVAALIKSEWQPTSPGQSLEQAIEAAFVRHGSLGYGTGISRERAKETFEAELKVVIEPVSTKGDDDVASVSEEPLTAADPASQ